MLSSDLMKALPDALLNLPEKDLKDMLRKEMQFRKLKYFVKGAWKQIEGVPMKWGKHLDLICEALELVERRVIKRLVINVPPRHCKSTIIGKCFSSWVWLREPSAQFLNTSYQQGLTIRDNVHNRRIMVSRWYKSLMQYVKERDPSLWDRGNLDLTADQNNKLKFDNNYLGYRIAGSIGGATTGHGGNFLMCDDPNNVLEAESDLSRQEANFFFDEVLQTRLNNPKQDVIVVIQQRTHERDVTGHILEKYGEWHPETNPNGYVFLKLPARYEGVKVINEYFGWYDWREEEGEPLWPEQFDDEELEKLEHGLGEYAAAGQLQQRPSPRGGGLIKPGRLIPCDVPPFPIRRKIRYWDFAASDKKKKKSKEPCWTAGVLLGELRTLFGEKRWIILDVVRGQWNPDDRNAKMRQTAELDGVRVPIVFEQEGGGAGVEVAQNTISGMAGFSIEADRPTGDKAHRAEPFAAQCNAGNVFILRAPWNQSYIAELETFPVGKFKDQVDATSGGFNKLVVGKKGGTW